MKVKKSSSRRSVTFSEEEWKWVENCHPPIISKKEFLKIADIRKDNAKNFTEGKRHPRHCLVGKIKCGDCVHTLAHTYSGRPKYYCNNKFLDQGSGVCRMSILDVNIEEAVLSMLQQYAAKKESIEDIGNIEKDARELYSGSVLIYDSDGSMDAALVLRSIFQSKAESWVRAGAGIVEMSNPNREFIETQEKVSSIAMNLVLDTQYE